MGLVHLVDHHKVEKSLWLWQLFGEATKEWDVYNFGILMLEVVHVWKASLGIVSNRA